MAILPPPRRREDSNVPVPIQAPAGVGAGVGSSIMQGIRDGRRDAATASLAKPMDQLRTEAYGGPGFSGPMPGGAMPKPARPASLMAGAAPDPNAPRAFNAPVQNQLGTMAFKNLQPRRGAPGAPMPPTDTAAAPTQQSAAGFTPYAEEQIGGAPRRISGFAGRRPGARYTEGPMKGKTQDQALLKAREQYAGLSPDAKAKYEGKARKEDISSTIPGIAAPTMPTPAAPDTPQRMSIDGAEMVPLKPGLVPNLPGNSPMPMPLKKKGASYPGQSPDGEEEDY